MHVTKRQTETARAYGGTGSAMSKPCAALTASVAEMPKVSSHIASIDTAFCRAQ